MNDVTVILCFVAFIVFTWRSQCLSSISNMNRAILLKEDNLLENCILSILYLALSYILYLALFYILSLLYLALSYI